MLRIPEFTAPIRALYLSISSYGYVTFWPDPENSLNCAKSGAAAQAVAPHRRLIPAPMVLSGTRYRGVCSGTVGSRRQNPSLSQDETHESSRILLAQWRVMTTHHCARRIRDESVASSRSGPTELRGCAFSKVALDLPFPVPGGAHVDAKSLTL